MVLDERRADIGAEALHGAVDAHRQAGILQQLAERDRGVRRQLVRLDDDGVAAQQRGKHFPGDAGERAVERHDRRADPDRLRSVCTVRFGIGLGIVLP